jgi:hypothetical protein
MLKFKFLLWALTKMLQRAAKKNPSCAQYIHDKSLVFQIKTASGVGRHFHIANGKISSSNGLTDKAKFTMTFSNAQKGFAVLSAKDGTDAFLTALRNGDLVINGDFVEVMWFQGLTAYLQSPAMPERWDITHANR